MTRLTLARLILMASLGALACGKDVAGAGGAVVIVKSSAVTWNGVDLVSLTVKNNAQVVSKYRVQFSAANGTINPPIDLEIEAGAQKDEQFSVSGGPAVTLRVFTQSGGQFQQSGCAVLRSGGSC